jgi:hypothetical protein
MRTALTSVLIVVFTLVAAVPSSYAQSHAAPQAALDRALEQHVETTAADREAVLRVLAHPEVKNVAGQAGIDLRRAASAVSTLDAAKLSEIAAQARQVEGSLAGGQSNIRISTTLIIIALLVVILIIVAVD